MRTQGAVIAGGSPVEDEPIGMVTGAAANGQRSAGALTSAQPVVTAMTEHPGWWEVSPGSRRRVVELADGGRWLLETGGGPVGTQALSRPASPVAEGMPALDGMPVLDEVELTAGAESVPVVLARQLRSVGTVVRLRNADLWDAVLVAILRQVIRAAQSKRLYRDFARAQGRPVELPDGGRLWLCPTPQAVLELDGPEYSRLGLAFKRRPLQAAAAAYLEHGRDWRALPAVELVERLQSVPRIGPWTAGAAVADWSNDFSVYPYDDLAVRTWARRADPGHRWPDEAAEFGRHWAAAAGSALSDVTLLTLAWGSLHGDIG